MENIERFIFMFFKPCPKKTTNLERARVVFSSFILLLQLVLGGPAHADMAIFSMLELAEQSDTAFLGEVVSVAQDTASVKVVQVLSGSLDSDMVTVTPIDIHGCMGSTVNFKAREKALIFGKKAGDGRVTVIAGGQGKIRIDPKTEEAEISATKRILAIARLKDEHARNEGMLAEVRSPNKRLRSESQRYIACRISHSELRQKYKDELASLLMDPETEIQRTGLQGIQFVKAEDSIPRMVELTRSQDLEIVLAASMALGKYDTPQSVAALIALTKHKEPRVRMLVCIDLDNSRRPEAKEALRKLLDDEDPKVRAMAPRGFVDWLRRDQADDILPKLVDMLNDPDAEVRASAADKLGESRNSGLVVPLLAALKKETHDDNMKRSILGALFCHCSKDDAKAQELVDKDIQLVVDALRNDRADDAFGPAFHAVGILDISTKAEAKDALRWAAQSHPNGEIRAYAKRCLSKRIQ